MRAGHLGLSLLAVMSLPVCAWASPRLVIRGAAARVVVIPEARSDIQVALVRANPKLPLRITRFGDTTFVDGGLGHAVRGCPLMAGRLGVRIRGLGEVAGADLPRLVVHTPPAVRMEVGDGVGGAVGRSASLDFLNNGCGRWNIGNVRGRLRLSQSGSGQARVGSAGPAEIDAGGGGLVTTHAIRGSLTVVSSGDGVVAIDSVVGPTAVIIGGSGSVSIRTGRASRLNVQIAGSGAARFGGVAGRVTASVAGAGYVSVPNVTGAVSRRVFGRGEILVGRAPSQTPRR